MLTNPVRIPKTVSTWFVGHHRKYLYVCYLAVQATDLRSPNLLRVCIWHEYHKWQILFKVAGSKCKNWNSCQPTWHKS